MSARKLGFALLLTVMTLGCSSGPEVRQDALPVLRAERTFESDLKVVWDALERQVSRHSVTERDPEEVSGPKAWNELKQRSLETDWIVSQSRDKYVEYQVNGQPRRKLLQVRYRLKVDAERVIGGTLVRVETPEEIERLKDDGSSDGFVSTDSPDPGRAGRVLDDLKRSLLSAPSGS